MSLSVGSIVNLPGGVEAVATAVYDDQGQQVSDFSPLVEFPMPPATSLLSAVAFSNSEVLVRPANPDRLGLFMVNDTDKPVYISFGEAVTYASFTLVLSPGATYEGPIGGYTGKIMALWKGEPTIPATFLHTTELLP